MSQKQCQHDTMDMSSYLFMSKKKRVNLSWRKMAKPSSSDSIFSTDSLEADHKKLQASTKSTDDNVDTILVPFYENDVLIKVPKNQKKTKKQNDKNEKSRKEVSPNYLMNKNKKKSYLDMFLKQCRQTSPTNQKQEKEKDDEYEISSVLPEFGDTERESIGEEPAAPVQDFYDTEPYNEMFYEKLLQEDVSPYLDRSLSEAVKFNEELRSNSPEPEENTLRSVSEVSQPRRQSRYSTGQPLVNVKLGGLGPDMEKIKPRLERARSLQRYSEKVRMENRLKIYKKSVQADIDKKASREPSARRQGSARESKASKDHNTSYLVNKTEEHKLSITRKTYESKSKSAGVMRSREGLKSKEVKPREPLGSRTEPKGSENKQNEEKETREKPSQGLRSKSVNHKEVDKEQKSVENRLRVKPREKSAKSKGMNTDVNKETIPPVQISFLVNVGGVRPSSTLKTLEEKHRMFQEQVKGFTLDNN